MLGPALCFVTQTGVEVGWLAMTWDTRHRRTGLDERATGLPGCTLQSSPSSPVFPSSSLSAELCKRLLSRNSHSFPAAAPVFLPHGRHLSSPGFRGVQVGGAGWLQGPVLNCSVIILQTFTASSFFKSVFINF